MVESFLAVPVHFTVEFLGFLVTAGGALLVLTRPGLIPGGVASRVTTAVGLFILSATQVAHGGAFPGFDTDGATVLVAARTVGLAFVLIGLTGRGAPSSAAILPGLRVRDPALFASAGASLLVALAAFAGSSGGGTKALRRLGYAALFFALGEALTAVVPDAEFGTGVVPTYALAAHGAKSLAFVFMGAWFWTAVKSSVRTRFVAAFAALLVGVILALSSALTGVISANVQEAELGRTRSQLRGAMSDLRQQTTDMKRDVGAMAEALADEIAQGAPLAQTLDQFRVVFEVDYIMLMNSNGRVTSFSLETGPFFTEKGKARPQPTKLDNTDILAINGSRVIDDVVRGAPFSAGPTEIGDRTVALMAANEVASPAPPGRRIGIIAAGTFVDALTMQEISNTLKPARASFIVNGRTVASELPKLGRRRFIPRDVQLQVNNGAVVAEQLSFGGRVYSTAFAPLRSGGGTIGIVALSTPADSLIAARQGLTSVLFLVALAVGAVALALAWLSGRRITGPIQKLTATAREVREGNLEVQAPVSGEDEVGQLGGTFNEMTASLFKMTNDLRGAAREEHRLRARIETIIESMADGLIAIDATKTVLAFNREAEHLTGIKASAALGKKIEEVLMPRDGQGEPVPVPIFDLSPGAVDGIYLARRVGEPVPVAMVSAALPGDEGEPAGGVLVIRDVSREREVERMKTEFLSNISHELRTPLTPIKGYAEILGRKDVPPEKTRKFVDGILESTSRLERIVSLLVDFSAMEAGRLAPKSTAVSVGDLVQDLALDWSKRTSRHEMVTDIGDGVPLVLGDERLLRRSLEEVIDNAVKFSPSGGTIRLNVSASNGAPEPAEVRITVSDEGIGIPAEDIPKIFSDFRQLDGSETRTFGGLGLGLAFVQRIVEAHDGTVRVESRPEEGTTLTILIPAAAEVPAGAEAGD